MTTYAEIEGEKPFDWNEFLGRDDLTIDGWGEASARSAYWVMCACGNLCNSTPRETNYIHHGRPVDRELACLGNDFDAAIRDRDRFAAMNILYDIEERAQQVLEEIACQG